MPPNNTIVAHIIVGQKPEPYFAAALDAIAGVCGWAVVNDNSGSQGANSEIAAQSQLARSGRLQLVRTRFTDFASARNACIDATPPEFRSGWALFLDADEVHGDELTAMVALLPRLPASIDAVDGYSRHFVGSFSWWISVERRRCFFRLAEDRRWHGGLHEQLRPLTNVVVLPAVWFHYGHVVTPRAEAEKSRLYAFLGGGAAHPDDILASVTPKVVWSRLLRRANRFQGQHPQAVLATIAALAEQRAAIFSEVDELVSCQSAADRVRNMLYRTNISRLLLWRRLQARLRWDWRGSRSDLQTVSYA